MVVAPGSATFSVTALGTAPITYHWNNNGSPISGATSPTYTTPPTTSADSDVNFTVTVSNSVGGFTKSPRHSCGFAPRTKSRGPRPARWQETRPRLSAHVQSVTVSISTPRK